MKKKDILKTSTIAILAALLVASTAAVSLTGCGGGDETPSSEASSEASSETSSETSSEETSSDDDTSDVSSEDEDDDDDNTISSSGAISEVEKEARQTVLDKVGDGYKIVSCDELFTPGSGAYKIGVVSRDGSDSDITYYIVGNGTCITEEEYLKDMEDYNKKMGWDDDDDDDDDGDDEEAARQNVLDEVGDDYEIVSCDEMFAPGSGSYKIGVRKTDGSSEIVYYVASANSCMTEEEFDKDKEEYGEFKEREQKARDRAMEKAGEGSEVIESIVLPSNDDKEVFKVTLEDADGDTVVYYTDGNFCKTEEEWLSDDDDDDSSSQSSSSQSSSSKSDDEDDDEDDDDDSDDPGVASQKRKEAEETVLNSLDGDYSVVSAERTNSVNHKYAYMIGVQKKGSNKVTYYFATDGMCFDEDEWYGS